MTGAAGRVSSEAEDDRLLRIRIPGWAREEPVPSDLYHFASAQEASPSLAINGETVPSGYMYVIQNTVYQSACGFPSLTVPAGLTSDELPVGISFDGLRGSDHRLLAIGRAFERARGPFPSPPGF